nr:MAG TPA: hypothetical protein [Caudoviricetes sp.]
MATYVKIKLRKKTGKLKRQSEWKAVSNIMVTRRA